MSTTYKNRLRCAVSAVASSGLGAWTVSTAASGAVTFEAGDDGKTFTVLALEGTTWETRRGCVYTHSGTSLSRGTIESSDGPAGSGNAQTFTTACVLDVTVSANELTLLAVAMQAVMPGGRLTLTTGTPVTTSDVTGATTIYYTPHVHDTIPLWDGSRWVPTTFAETSEALGTLTSGLPYDVFGFLSSGVLDLEKLAWTSTTARATAVTLQDGRYCKSGDKTRLWLGTFYTTSTTTTEDSNTKRFLSNAYNRVDRRLYKTDATSHSYNGGYRQWGNTAGNKVEFVIGDPIGCIVSMASAGEGASSGAVFCINAQKLDATTGFDFLPAYAAGIANGFGAAAVGEHMPATGYHYIAATESTGSTGSATFSSCYLIGSLPG